MLKNILKALVQPYPFAGIMRVPGFFRDWREYTRKGGAARIRDIYPQLLDKSAKTPFDAHYFYQGAWLARKLYDSGVDRHLDIGSSVMTVAAISGFITVDFLDYRPLEADLPGLNCVGGSILNLPLETKSAYSISCLHVIEHIGLGRYGDSIDPLGSEIAVAELERIAAGGCDIYISTPIGRARTCFNAHRVFNPYQVIAMFSSADLISFDFVNDAGRLVRNGDLDIAATCDYGCGLFHLRVRRGGNDAQ
jgi:Caenorhabditis protein of unknown function, DUF268